ncbi:MAG: glycogen-debranching protein [Cellulosilyticaceae bacterium]
MYTITVGTPELGVTWREQETNFCIFSSLAECMKFKLYAATTDDLPCLEVVLNRNSYATGDLFHIQIDNLKEGMSYSWQVIDHVGKESKPLIDPYAYSVIEYPKGSNEYRNVVVGKCAYARKKPQIPWEKTIIYELHVGFFTKHPSSNVKADYRGSFEGLVEKLPYLKELGVTTLELLPVFKWNPNTLNTIHPITGIPLKDEWGYNTIAFFALQNAYSGSKAALDEIKAFKQLIECAHNNDLEIILDVVYNHSGEGSEPDKIFNFKVLGKDVYYKLNTNGDYLNCAGTGNTLNTAHSIVKKMILDSLKYWVIYMGVDGFRFDLASILGQDECGKWMHKSLLNDIAEDPVLGNVKLIAESWDAKGSYDVGRMPYPFAEWSDYFRDTIRKFIKGELGLTKAVANCVMGTEIYYTDSRKNCNQSIHFITAHDGFTMWDLVSYNNKNNGDNGEDNRDGNNANYSYNCGAEGITSDAHIIQMRKRHIKSYMALLLLSKGVPMILMGDEMGRSQQGNNNAYCQDNLISWLDWQRGEDYKEIYWVVKGLIKFRKNSPYFNDSSQYTVSWHGVAYNQPDWSYHSRSIAWHIKGAHEAFYVIANSYIESLQFELPPATGGWTRLLDTAKEGESSFNELGVLTEASNYVVEPFSICLFKETP